MFDGDHSVLHWCCTEGIYRAVEMDAKFPHKLNTSSYLSLSSELSPPAQGSIAHPMRISSPSTAAETDHINSFNICG